VGSDGDMAGVLRRWVISIRAGPWPHPASCSSIARRGPIAWPRRPGC